MRKSKALYVIVVVIAIIFIVTAIHIHFSIYNGYEDATMKQYYSREDFEFVVLGETTAIDVYKIYPNRFLQVTSYGGYYDYPTQDDGYIRIKFCGEELIAFEIIKCS